MFWNGKRHVNLKSLKRMDTNLKATTINKDLGLNYYRKEMFRGIELCSYDQRIFVKQT